MVEWLTRSPAIQYHWKSADALGRAGSNPVLDVLLFRPREAQLILLFNWKHLSPKRSRGCARLQLLLAEESREVGLEYLLEEFRLALWVWVGGLRGLLRILESDGVVI